MCLRNGARKHGDRGCIMEMTDGKADGPRWERRHCNICMEGLERKALIDTKNHREQANDGEYDGWTPVAKGHSPPTWSTVCFVGMVIASARACVRRRRKASAGEHTANVPMPERRMATNAGLNSLADEAEGLRRRKHERRRKAEDVRLSIDVKQRSAARRLPDAS